MTHATVVRYTTRPETALDNEQLIRGVFAELAANNPEGLRYVAFRLDDGVSFLHVAVLDGDENPLMTVDAFRQFLAGINDRCVDGPTPSDATQIGSYPPG
jgi:hypothetical protein